MSQFHFLHKWQSLKCNDFIVSVNSIGTGMEINRQIIISPMGVVVNYCDQCICLSVCLSDSLSPEPHARSLPNFLCMLRMSVDQFSSGMLMIGRIAYRGEGVFFPIDNALERTRCKRDHSIASNVMQHKGSFHQCCIR